MKSADAKKASGKTIMIPAKLHSELWIAATARGMNIGAFVVSALWRVVGRKQK